MADHIVLNAKSFMKGHSSVNTGVTKGHAKGDMSSYQPVNPHTPTSGPKDQASMVPKMSGPVKPGKKGTLNSIK